MPDADRKTSMDRTFRWLLVAFVLYAGAFILQTSMVVDGVRYFNLFDDAMVSMRYARNLAQGAGLVWNPGGPRVEGFSNPLWVLYMAGWHLLPLPMEKISLVIQLSALVFLLLNLVYVRRIAERLTGSAEFALWAVLLTAFYLPLNNWALQGMEVSALALLVSYVTWQILEGLRTERFSPLIYLWLGVGTWLRMDMVFPALVVVAFMATVDRAHRVRHLLVGGVILLLAVGLQTGLRYWYYGAWLPNTYYLKLTGYPVLLRLCRGFLMAVSFIYFANVVFFGLPWVLLRFRGDRRLVLLALLFGVQLGYSIYVGGDAWEWWGGSNRYISIVMPLFFILFCAAVQRPAEWLRAHREQSGWSEASLKRLVGAILFMSLINFNAIHGPASLTQWVFLEPPLHRLDNEVMVAQARIINQITAPQAKVGVVWAGTVPYYCDRVAIDLLGKNDPVIAHSVAWHDTGLAALTSFVPGHMKWNYAYSIGQLQPDVVIQVWWERHDADPYLKGTYRLVKFPDTTMYLRQDSPYIRWDQVQALAEQ